MESYFQIRRNVIFEIFFPFIVRIIRIFSIYRNHIEQNITWVSYKNGDLNAQLLGFENDVKYIEIQVKHIEHTHLNVCRL